jgi:phage shock protein A
VATSYYSDWHFAGLLFGSQIGANLGAQNALNKARKEEMERLGITQEMLDSAEQVGIALEQATEGLRATKNSLETQQSLARRLERYSNELYEKAKTAMAAGNEDEARKFLLERTRDQDSVVRVLKLCIEEKQRLEKMEQNVAAIEKRALEIEALLQRSVGAKARQSSMFDELSLPVEDPLVQKFRDLGIE